MSTTHVCPINGFQAVFDLLVVYEGWTERNGPWDWRVAKDKGELRCPVNHADSVKTMIDAAHSIGDNSLRLFTLDLNAHGLAKLSAFNAAFLSVLLDSQTYDIAKVDIQDATAIAAEAHPASLVPRDVCQALCGRSLASFDVPFPSETASTSPVSAIVFWKKSHRAYLLGPNKSYDALLQARRDQTPTPLGCSSVLELAHRVAVLYQAKPPNPTVVAELLDIAIVKKDLTLATTVVTTLETFTSNVAPLVRRSRRLVAIFGWTALRSSFAAHFSRSLKSWDHVTTALSWTYALVTMDATRNANELLDKAWLAMGRCFAGLSGSPKSLTNLLHHVLVLYDETEARADHSRAVAVRLLQPTLPDEVVRNVTRFLPKRSAAPDAACATLLDTRFRSAQSTLRSLLPLLAATVAMRPTLRMDPCIGHVIKALAYMETLPDPLYKEVTAHLDVLGSRVIPGLSKLASRGLLTRQMLDYFKRTTGSQNNVARPQTVRDAVALVVDQGQPIAAC
ncbi:hypothetical protein SDRG_11112 [Saprolegnia diclina VS20]|uniref:Uncharacterized protein n=1 Tax=Saprolegnia diclina (strain VS20) TaxID=1156394 RepID=T0RMI9_SAPDV|nr:hypothetical protein SDRG_11112 [Saprolegnia diclina VS20]EQC31187.1 hypothetical protein SDRG_11112 [Saprolegnia diclina VS20]|eukprot:XP_008615360.1 hypothetical protein SDRG_11112 [Saprolegnia diclina VS20]